MPTPVPVPYDPQIHAGGMDKSLPTNRQLRPDMIQPTRDERAAAARPLTELAEGLDVDVEDHVIAVEGGAAEIGLSVVRPRGRRQGSPGILHIHGGGMVLGDRADAFHERVIPWVLDYGAVVVVPDYRRAPDDPHPAPSEDCYAALTWMAGRAADLGIEPGRLIVAGGSAGGGLSAALALMSRDRGGPALMGQMLICPMIDDRNITASSRQYDGFGPWDRTSNFTGWDALLGEERGGPEVSPYAAPSRATDLAGLAPAYIEVGSAEIFRDEDVAYAGEIWAAGGQAELHVWSGGFHGFEMKYPEAQISQAALAARDSWFRRILEL